MAIAFMRHKKCCPVNLKVGWLVSAFIILVYFTSG